MSINRPSGLFKAFIPEQLGKRYHRLNEGEYQDILNLMREEEVEVFEIVNAEAINLADGKRLEKQTRRWVKLTTNKNGQLCYLEPPNSIRVIDRNSKPLFLTERILEEIEKMRQKDDLLNHRLNQHRGLTRQNVWVAIMADVGRSKDYAVKNPEEDCLQVCFAVSTLGSNRNETIDLYVKAITGEIDAAEKKAKSPVGRILCNGLVKNEHFIINGLRIKLEKLGYKVLMADLPVYHSGQSSHKRMLVEKNLK